MKIIRNILLLLVIIIGFSCQRMEPEIVEANYTYTPDKPNGIDRDKVDQPPVDVLTQYVFFEDNNQTRAIFIEADGANKKVHPIEDVLVKIRTAVPVKEPLAVELLVMTKEEFPKTFADITMTGNKILPKDAYSLSQSSVDFKEGDLLKEIKMTFNNDKLQQLEDDATFLVPLVVKATNNAAIKTHNYFLVSISKKEIKALPSGNNTEIANDLPNNLQKIPYNNLTFTSTYAPSHVFKLNDGKLNYWENWWVDSKSDTELNVDLQGNNKVKAIVIYTLNDAEYNKWNDRALKQVDISASNTNGSKYIYQGKAELTKSQKQMIIVFKEAIEATHLKLYNFIGMSGTINIHEVEVYTE